MKPATSAIRFIEGLRIPTGPMAGQLIKLAPFQRQFLKGALEGGIDIGVLSVGRGNGKSTLTAGVALAELTGAFGDQPRREVLIAAKNRDQAGVAFNYAVDLMHSLPEEVQKRVEVRRSPKLEMELDGEHVIRAVAADGRGILGTSPTLVICDERAAWPLDQGNDLEGALLTGAAKRNGRTLIISTSAADDAHPFSRWLDNDLPGVYRQEHRPSPSLPADDKASLEMANPGSKHGAGPPMDRLMRDAALAIMRGGSTLTNFRLFHRNERVSGDDRDVLLSVDEWLNCETADLPGREGEVVVGIDLGGSASMTASAFYWPATGRLEAHGWFPSRPGLLDRGQADGVSSRYVEMAERGELSTLGAQTVPVASWIAETLRHIEGETIAALVADRYKQAEIGEALDRAGARCPVVWRGMGFKDGAEDIDRFRRAAFDGHIATAPSLLLRSAMQDAVCKRDDANNTKLTKARSLGRIDPAAASVLAVAEGARITARGVKKAVRFAWN